MTDIFVSYTSSDRAAAFWIAAQLREFGYDPHIHEWELKGSADILEWMQRTHQSADHVLCVLSDAYMDASFSTLERNATIWQAASSRPGFALLVQVMPCSIPTIFSHLRRCDLQCLGEDAARTRLRDFIEGTPPPDKPPYFGQTSAIKDTTTRLPRVLVHRGDVLSQIDESFAKGPGFPRVVALTGIRGVGKTTLAAHYLYSRQEKLRAICWLRAYNAHLMEVDLIAFAQRIGWLTQGDKTTPVSFVVEQLSIQGKDILLVFDNAPSAISIMPFLPTSGDARVLITSNSHFWKRQAQVIELHPWPQDVGARYLVDRTGQSEAITEAEELTDHLGGLPLALEQAAAYCEYLNVRLSDYTARFLIQPIHMLSHEHSAVPDYNEGITVARTFDLALEQVRRLEPKAVQFLSILAMLSPDSIPTLLFRDKMLFNDASERMFLGDEDFEHVVAVLRSFALVALSVGRDKHVPDFSTDVLQVHRLVRRIVLSRLDGQTQQSIKTNLLKRMALIYPKTVNDDTRVWPMARSLDAVVTDLVSDEPATSSNAADLSFLLDRLASFRQVASATLPIAERLFSRSLSIRQTEFGEQHALTATSLNNLGSLKQDMGLLDEAATFLERAMAIRVTLSGEVDRESATAFHNLGSLRHAQRRLNEAKLLHQKALSIRRNIFGKNHPHFLISLNSLAVVLRDQKDYLGAMRLLRKALYIFEQEPDRHRIDLARAYGDYASVLREYGKNAEAIAYFRKEKAVIEGQSHSRGLELGSCLSNLAGVLRISKNFSEAEELYRQSIQVHEEVLGKTNVRTAQIRHNLAVLYADMGDKESSERLFRQALSILEQEAGPADSRTALTRRLLAALLSGSQG